MEYGIVPTGFNRKPLAVILAEIEAKNITEFGPELIQTAQSPMGQLNGLFADLVTELWEQVEDVYQSYDPDQAEGTRLDTLGRLRLLRRNGAADSAFRQAITNLGQGRVDIQDLVQAIANLDGVTYARVFINETGEIDFPELEKGVVAVAVMGGDDEKIADALRYFIAPGVSTYGNTRVTTNVDGFCRSMSIIRPIEVEVKVDIVVRRVSDQLNCPPPSVDAIEELVENAWLLERSNGYDPSFYSVRAIIERAFTNVEVVSVTGERDEIVSAPNDPVKIGFIEIAKLVANVVSL